MDAALKLSGLSTKREAIEAGLKLLVEVKRQEAVRKYQGKLKWMGDLNEMRDNKNGVLKPLL